MTSHMLGSKDMSSHSSPAPAVRYVNTHYLLEEPQRISFIVSSITQVSVIYVTLL